MPFGIKSKVRPSDINTGGPFAPLFGFDRANVSANMLVRLAQQNGSWRIFGIDELDQLSEMAFVFNGLTSGRCPLIIPRKDGKYAFTDEFIERCVASAPKKSAPVAPNPMRWRAAGSAAQREKTSAAAAAPGTEAARPS